MTTASNDEIVLKSTPSRKRLPIYMAGVSLAALIPLQAITITAQEVSQRSVAVLSPASIPHLVAVLPPPPIPFPPKNGGAGKNTTSTTSPTSTPAGGTLTTLPTLPSVAIIQGATLNVSLIPGQTVVQVMQIANTGGTKINQLSFGVIGNPGALSDVVLSLVACDSAAWTSQAQAASGSCAQPSDSSSATIGSLETGNLFVNVTGLTTQNPIWIDLYVQLPLSATNATSNQRVQLQEVMGVSG